MLGYANEVKRDKLWCLDSKFSKFIISREVTFNEYKMLSPRNEQLHVENNPGMRENMEFMPNALEIIEKTISMKPKNEEVQHLDDKENTPQKQ